MRYRRYDPERDRKDVYRIWLEVGWLEASEKNEAACYRFFDQSDVFVAEVHGEAEAMAATMPGDVRYLDEELSFCGVTAVATSRVARRQGFAGRLTAQAVASAAAEGVHVAGLGMFEQGFYNRLGFGTGSYEHWVHFDPGTLRVPRRARIPRRLSVADWEAIHASRLSRMRCHGSCNLLPDAATRSEMEFASNGYGLGYYDDPNGELTHHLWGQARGENGPYSVWWTSYRTYDQLLELLALLQGLGDQIHLVRMREMPGIQFQDLLAEPFKHRRVSARSEFENRMRAMAYWQVRICDLAGALAQTHLACEPVRFNLRLHDPIADYLDGDAPWRGLSGEYVVTLGPESAARAGTDAGLPVLVASVGAFSRMWFGVRPATTLAATDELAGPPDLLAALDEALRLPLPTFDWDF